MSAPEIPQVEQIQAWLNGIEHVDHDTFAFGREFGEALMDEIRTLRSVVQFADGFVVSETMRFGDHTLCLADLYNETCAAAGAIQRAGCHARGKFRAAPPVADSGGKGRVRG